MWNHIGRSFLVVITAVILAACATSGKQFDRTHIHDVKKGAQNKEQIRSWFGEPYQVTTLASGQPGGCVERWTYVHAYASHGGAKATSAALVVDFDKNNKVCDTAYSETKK